MSIERELAAQTIVAIASPPGGALRGVVRLSGPAARELVEATSQIEAGSLGERGVYRARFDDGRGGQPTLLFWMPGPASYTREDVVEIHGPGAVPLVDAVLRRLLDLGARLAGPGEFTRRAFENGRIDLTRAEGVLELVHAANERERRAGSALLFGGLGDRIAVLRDRLLDLRVLCEASLDFEEADTGHVPLDDLDRLGREAQAAIEEALGFERRRVRRSGAPRVVLCGAPNAGKSTLFNALCGADALVSEHPGATRDTLRARWSPGEFECELVDTAGLDAAFAQHSDLDHPDVHAQARARGELASADLLVLVARADGALPSGADWASWFESHAGARIVAWAQCDREGAALEPPGDLLRAFGASRWVRLSACERTGLDAFARLCVELLAPPSALSGEGASTHEISERHLTALATSRDRLAEALELLRSGEPLDVAAQTLRTALDALDEIVGRTTPEAVLDRLFSRFCIGK